MIHAMDQGDKDGAIDDARDRSGSHDKTKDDARERHRQSDG